MAKIVIGIIAALASFMLVESLTCNSCSYGLGGYCAANSEVNCTTNTSVCFTGKVSFTSLSKVGFNTQGCLEPASCNTTTNGTLLLVGYEKKIDCCSTDSCNPVETTPTAGAPSTKMTLTAAVGVAVLAFMWGSIL